MRNVTARVEKDRVGGRGRRGRREAGKSRGRQPVPGVAVERPADLRPVWRREHERWPGLLLRGEPF